MVTEEIRFPGIILIRNVQRLYECILKGHFSEAFVRDPEEDHWADGVWFFTQFA